MYRKTHQSLRKVIWALSHCQSFRKPTESIFIGWEIKNWSDSREQITDKNSPENLETWGHALEFIINEMISLDYQLKVILNSG